jgi:hypothetical protein
MKIQKPTAAERERFAGLVPADSPMGSYVTLPADWPVGEAEQWVAKALDAAAALPPNQAKRKPAKRAT